MFSVFLGFLIPSLLVREQAFLGLIWSDPIGIFTLSASLGPHIYNVGIIGKQPNKQISQNNQKPQDTHRYVIFQSPRSLSTLPSSLHPSEYCYVCFICNS